MAPVLAALFGLLTAIGNATGTVLQRIAARRVPAGDAFSPRLVRHLLRSPAWLGGIAVIVVAAVCQALALVLGSLALVQPILVTELPFTLLIASALSRRRLPTVGWVATALIACGLGVGLAAAAPTEGHNQVTLTDWALALAATGGAMAACVLSALTRGRGMARAALFGTASAIGYALTAALMKTAAGTLAQRGVGPFLTDWHTYACVAAGAWSLFLLANAMESGPLVASQPSLTLGEALVSLALGILLYGDQVRTGWWLVPAGVGAVLVTWGVFLLPRAEVESQASAGP